MPLTVEVLDTAVTICGPPAVLSGLKKLGLTETSQAADHLVKIDGELMIDGRLVPGIDEPDEISAVLVALNTLGLSSTKHFAVHAGVVAANGLAVAAPAVSGAGKSTLVAACVQLGLDYVSDEALLVDEDLNLHPYARPISLSAWSLSALGLGPGINGLARPLALSELGGSLATPPLRLALIVSIRRGRSAKETPLSRAEGAKMLLVNSFNHYRDTRRAFTTATALAAGAASLQLEYDDPKRAAARVQHLIMGSLSDYLDPS